MTLSNKTLASPIALGKDETITIGTNLTATERAELGEFSKDVKITRRSPNTAVDMYNLEVWQKNDSEPKGSAAKSHPAFKRYRNDMETAQTDNEYKKNTIYIDTTKKIGPQLEKLK